VTLSAVILDKPEPSPSNLPNDAVDVNEAVIFPLAEI